MISLSFHCKNTPSQREAEIIKKYWALKEGEFVNKPVAIARAFEITVPQLKALIKEYSGAVVTYGSCMDCERSLEAQIYSQTRFKRYQSREIVPGWRCKECASVYDFPLNASQP